MTDRDFKLLVRKHFAAKYAAHSAKDSKTVAEAVLIEAETEKQINTELSRFTQQEIEELPFSRMPEQGTNHKI